jgi:hypothetical protein
MSGGPPARTRFIVKVDQAIDRWTKILSVFAPGQLDQPIVRQHSESRSDVMEAATFVDPNGCETQLLTAPNDDGAVSRRLARHGEGVDSLYVGHQVPKMSWQAWTFVASETSHGPFSEIAYPQARIDGRWKPGYDVDATGPQTG